MMTAGLQSAVQGTRQTTACLRHATPATVATTRPSPTAATLVLPVMCGLLDRVPGRTEGRGVREIDLADLRNRVAVEDGGRQHIEPLGDLGPECAEELRAQQLPRDALC